MKKVLIFIRCLRTKIGISSTNLNRMKATFLFLFVVGLSGVLASSYAQDKKLSLQMKEGCCRKRNTFGN